MGQDMVTVGKMRAKIGCRGKATVALLGAGRDWYLLARLNREALALLVMQELDFCMRVRLVLPLLQ